MSYVKQIKHVAKPDYTKPMEFLAIGLFQDKGLGTSQREVDKAVGGLIAAVLKRKDFKGKKNEILMLHTTTSPAKVVLVGLGEAKKFTADVARQATGKVVQVARKHNQTSCGLLKFEAALPDEELTQAIAEGLILGSYQFMEHKKPEKDARELKTLTLVGAASKAALNRGVIVGTSVCLARDLQNHPSNVATPTHLAKEAQRIAKAKNMTCTVFGRPEFTRLGMGALAGVAAGTDQPPKFILIEYKGGKEGEAPLAVVGKGLTFDAGGICIKPSDKMDEMKFDMSGGAATLGIMEAVSRLQPKLNIIAAIPSTENLLGGSAQKPGDIVKAYNGKTIEVINTDAEGRLILADALAYVVDKYKPTAILDFATLTGAVLIALGHRASGLLGNNEDLIAEVKEASEKTGERVWQLPLWEDYKEDIKSKVADVKNIGEGRLAGTIAGGIFLQEFVGDTPWVHLDIAGTAWQGKDQPYTPGGGSGVAVRLVTHIILERAGK
jgi:leucyl aminopeptidase